MHKGGEGTPRWMSGRTGTAVRPWGGASFATLDASDLSSMPIRPSYLSDRTRRAPPPDRRSRAMLRNVGGNRSQRSERKCRPGSWKDDAFCTSIREAMEELFPIQKSVTIV